MDDKLIGVMALIGIFIGASAGIVLTPDQEHTYYCESTGVIGVFWGGTSQTNLTAYPYSQNRTKSVKCPSLWVKYTGITNNPPDIKSIRYSCNLHNCTIIG